MVELVDALAEEFLREDPKFQHIFRDVGLLDILISFLLSFVEETEAWKITKMEASNVLEVVSLAENPSIMKRMPRFKMYTQTLLVLLTNNRQNIEIFRKRFFVSSFFWLAFCVVSL